MGETPKQRSPVESWDCAAFLKFYEQSRLIGDKLSIIGKHSMEIYVSHLIPLAVCRIVLYKIVGSTQLDLIVWLSFFFALIMVRIFLLIVAKLRLSAFLFGR